CLPHCSSQATGALEQALGMTTWQAGLIPAVRVGDQLLLADADNAAVKMSQASYSSALMGHTEIIPVVTGDPTNIEGHSVIGFVAIKFTAIGLDSSNQRLTYLERTLEQAAVPQQPPSHDQAGATTSHDAAIPRLSPEPVRLVYNN